jgi:hypothetical protein
MLKKLTHRLRRVDSIIETRFIILLIVFTGVFTLAGGIWLVVLMQSKFFPAQTTRKDDCASCHAETYASWHVGAHGDSQAKNALAQGSNCQACHKDTSFVNTNVNSRPSVFADFWVQEGMPNNCLSCHATGYDENTKTWKSDGIACETCHGVIPENHPDAVVSIDKSEENCRTCHNDTRFDWGKWKNSVHFQNSLVCVDCHNPHDTSLKIAGNTHGSPSQLCGNCHKKIAESSEHSIHTKIGITCTECHLGEPKGNDDFHQISDHDFKAKIETCNKCHSGQMHLAGDATITNELRAYSRVKVKAGSKTDALVENHSEMFPNPFGFIAAAILFGVIGGATLRKSISR